MALPSQTEHNASSNSRTFVYKRRPKNSRFVLFGLGAVIVGAGAIFLISRYGVPKSANAKNPDDSAKLAPTMPPPAAVVTEPEPVRPNGPLSKGLDIAKSDQPPDSRQASRTQTNPPHATPEGARPAPIDLTNPGAKPGDAKSAPAPEKTPPPAVPATASTSDVKQLMSDAEKKLSSGDPVGARSLFSKALLDSRTVKADQETIRAKVGAINDDILFSPKVVKGDAFSEEYDVKSGDSPVRIARKRDLDTAPGLIERVNKIDPHRLKVGQRLKLIRGPFHAVVHKTEYRLDLFAGNPDDPQNWVFIKSFKVGLGEANGTPVGNFFVKPKSKLVNPHWVNPRTGQKFDADDPANPIGERWIGIEGIGPAAVYTGFGIHGTIDPASIGQQKSMGCIRMNTDDISLIYDLLTEKVSLVKIEP